MAGGSDLGYYTLPVILSFAGVDKQVNSTLGKTFGVAGKKSGTDFAKSVAAGISADRSIEKASEAKAKAADKLADALGKVKVAQAQLTQAESRGNIAGRARALEAVAAAERKVAAETRGQASAAKELERAIRQADDAKKRLNSSGGSGGFLSGLSGAGGISNNLEGFASKFGTAGSASGAAFVAGAGAALLAGGLIALGTKAAGLVAEGFESVVSAGVDFDKTFNNFQAVTRSNTSQMAAFRQEAIALGGDTQIAGANASDAATAMTELAKAGFSVDQSMGAARGTLQLAAAAQITAAEAATIEGNALNAFGLQADSAGRAADILANVANASSGEMTDFAYGLQAGGTVAHQFGLTIDDTATALGLLANSGIKGSDAGTLLKSALLALTDQGNPAQGAIHDLGLTVYDTTGKFVGMKELFGQLQTASHNMTPEMYQARTSILFGSDAARLSGIAAEKGVDGWNKMADAVAQQGTAADVAAIQNQGLPGVIENIKNSVDTMKLSLYDVISGPLKSLGGEAQGAFGDLQAAVNSHKPELIGAFTDLSTVVVAGLSGSLRSIGLFTEGIGQMIGGLGNLVGAINQTGEALAYITGDDAKEKYFHDQAQGAYGWGEGLQAAGKALQEAADGVNNLKPGLQLAGDAAKNSAIFVRELGDKVKLLPDQKTIVLNDNSSEAIANIDRTKYAITQIPGTKDFKLVPITAPATAEVDAWIRDQTGKNVTPPVVPDLAQANVAMQAFRDQWRSAGIVTPVIAPPASPPPASGTPLLGGVPFGAPPGRALGGIFDVWDSVASFANGKLPAQAMIQAPVAGAGLVQWAEPSTGGEAFIPINGGARSRAIWAETGRRLMSFEQGGFRRGIDALYSEAQALQGTKYSMASGDDCSGTMSQLVNVVLGLAPKASRMSTATASKWLSDRGALPGFGPPGTFSMGWKNGGPGGGHMAGTLPDGTHVEMGGANGGYTLGGNAKGADDPEFTNHAYLPLEALYPDGVASGGGFGLSAAGASGGVAGVGPNGESGSYSAPTAKAVREANEKVADADARVAKAEARQKELKADAKDSEKLAAQTDLDKAKREAADARADQAEVMKGKFTAGAKGGKGGGGTDVNGSIGGILKSFVSETFGLDGSLFPDISNLAPVKMVGGLIGALGGGGDAGTSNSPFGIPDVAVPPPGSAASGAGLGPLPGPAPITVDASTNIAGNVGWDKDKLDRDRNAGLHRAISRIPAGS